MNSLVAEYRKRVPNDPRSDDALTLLLGQSNADGRFNGYKDFVDDYTRLSQPEPAEKPPIGAEFRMGVNRGVASLKSSAAGLGALGADVVGADSLRDSLVQKYNDIEQQSSADNPAGVAKIEDIKGAGDAARYALGKAGELVPNVAEAAAFGLAGAAAGTAIEPGGGTAAGGTAGFLEGFLQKQAAKSALKALLEKGDKIIADKAARELVVGQLESIAKREAVSELAPATQALMETEGKALARKYGANAAEVLNFGGLGAGGQFPRAQQTNPEDAKVSALIAGIGGAAGTILPGSIINKLLPGVAEEPAKEYLQRLALNAAQHIPAGVVGMGAMELGNIAAERYADPAKRDQPLSEEELSRIMNAAVVGGMAGAVTAPVTAIRGPRNFDPSVKAHFPDVTEQRMNDIDDAIARQKAGTETAADTSTLRTLNAQEQAYKAVAEEQVQPSSGTPDFTKMSASELTAAGYHPTYNPGGELIGVLDKDGNQVFSGSSRAEPSDASNTESPAVVSAAGPANDEQPVAATGPAASPVPTVDEGLQRKRAAAAVSVKAEDATVRAAKAKVAAASAQTNPTPTTSERLAGNYQKGHLAGADVGLPGVTIAIENPVGSERSGMSAEGQPWKVTMPTTYGQILGTKGRDGDPLDIHIGPNPTAETVYVIDQITPARYEHESAQYGSRGEIIRPAKTSLREEAKFDEHKIMLGFESKVQAEAAYDAGFSDGKGPERRAAVTPMTKPELREWLKDEDDTKHPVAYQPQQPSPERFDSLEDLLKFREQRRQEEIALYQKEIGLTRAEAERLQGLMARDGDTEKFESKLPKDQKDAMDRLFNGPLNQKDNPHSFKFWEYDKRYNPEELLGQDDVRELADNLLHATQSKVDQDPYSDRFIYAAVAARKFKEHGGTQHELSEAARRYAARNSGSSGDAMELFKIAAARMRDFLRSQGVDILESKKGEKVNAKRIESTEPVHAHGGESGGAKPNEQAAVVESGAGVRGSGQGPKPEKSAGESGRQPETKPAEAKPSGGKSVAAPKEPTLAPAAKAPNPEEVADVERRGLGDTSGRGRRGEEAQRVEPAWFRPSGKEDYPELAKRLLSDASPSDQGARNSQTHRLTAIEDKQTGKVHLVSTFENNKEARVTRFTDAVKAPPRAKSISLRGLLTGTFLPKEENKPLQNRFEVLGSVRSKEPTEYQHSVFENRKDFEDRFGKVLDEKQRAMARTMEAVERANVQQTGKPAEESGPEPEEEVANDEPSVGPEFEHEPEPINLEAHEVKVLADKMPEGTTVDDLADMITAKSVDPDLLAVLKKIAVADPSFFTRVEEVGTLKALKEYGYKIDAGTGEQVERGAGRAEGTGVPNSERGVSGGASGPAAVVDRGENPPRKTEGSGQQEGGTGDNEGNAEPPGTGEEVDAIPDLVSETPETIAAGRRQDVESVMELRRMGYAEVDVRNSDAGQRLIERGEYPKNTIPNGWESVENSPQEEHDRQAEALLNRLHEAAARAGMDVRLFNAKAKGGAYNLKDRRFMQALTDTVGRGDVKTALHEIGHDVFSGEAPEVRDRLLNAIDRLTDEALGVDMSADTRIRSSDPANLGKPGVNEERLVDATAQKLLEEGFDPAEAKGFAQSFVRTLKDLYYRAAMAVQRWLGHPENPELARRYFENRVRSLLAGDVKGQSYGDFTGSEKRPRSAIWKEHFDNGRILGERVSPNGRVEYDHVPDLNLAGVRFNLPEPMPNAEYSRKVEVDQVAARLNHLAETVAKAGRAALEDPAVAAEAQRLKLAPDAFARRVLRLQDPAKSKQWLENQREVNGDQVDYDPNKKLEDFRDKANRDQNIRAAYGNVERLWNRAGEGIAEREALITPLEDKLDRYQKRLTKAQSDLESVKELKKDSSTEVRNIDKTIGKFEYKRDSIKRRVLAVERKIERTKIEVAALKKMAPAFEREKTRLGGKIQIGVETTWGNGMPYNVVEKPNATSAEILAKDDDGQVKSARKLKLDSTGAMTDPKEVDEAIRKNTEFLAHREALAAAGDENALDDVYQGIKHQRDEMLANKDYSLRVGTAERLMFGLTISPTGKRLSDGLGTPSARSAERRLNRYETILNTLHPAVEKYGRVSLQLENDLIRLAPELTHETLRQDVIFPAIHIIEQATDLAERYASDPAKRDRAIYQRVREKLLRNDALRSRIGGVIDKFMPLLEKKIRHSYEASQYIHNAVREGAGVKREFGLGVQDKSLKAVNPATGARETASRAPLEVGPYTFSKRFSRMARAMSQALRASGWDGFSDSVDEFAAAQNDEERAAASEELLTYTNHEDFGETVKNDFVKELVTMEHKSPFFAPAEEGEVARVPASPELMQEAFEQSGFAENGDLVALAEAMHEAHGGEGDSAPYVEETLRRFGEFYKDIVSKLSEAEPDPSPSNPTIRGMMAPALIDARSIAHLPGSWLDYHSYDQRDMLNQLMRVSSELAFGRGQEGLATDFETMAKESMGAKARISAALRELQVKSPHASEKEARAFLEKRFGKETYATLKRQAAMDNRITDSIRDLSDYFRKGNSPDGSLRALTRGAHALGMMLVNQPASAIRNMEQIFAGFMKYGVSRETLGATTHAVKEFATEAVNSFTQALGVNLQMESERHQRYVDLGHQDPAIVKKWHDAFDPQQGEGKTTRFFRGLTDVMGQGMNRLGPEGKHTVFRPFQPFTWTAIMQDEALNHLTWDLAERFVRRGIDFYQANPEKLGDLNHKLLPENMGLKGASLDTFKRFHAAMQRWDLSYDDMVRGAMKRADKTLFTDEEAQRLYGLSVSELSSESNIATMPPAAFNNSVLRVISPLLGWPFRRMMDVVSVGRTPEGKHDLATLARGLAGLSVLALGGLGVSALVNQYQENVVGKKPNLRGLLDAPDGKEMALGIFENLSRAGTLGLLGEGINGLANVGLGGDNRTIFSLDQRVVALSAMASLQQAVSSWVNQGQADYAHVIRPVLGSMGGSGALQYMDIANHVLDLDNPEARYVARINAQNYLRVVGRQLGLEVRASAGGPGGYSPTPLSPALTRMELAAYKNNAADFQEAYYEAVQKAKEAGYEDPVGHIKQSFSARNPLRTVFAVSPTKGDYNRILATLPDGGRHDVEEAVTLFNKYVESIGGREFEGKAEKKEPDFTKGQRFTMPAFGSGGRPLTSDRAVSAVFSR